MGWLLLPAPNPAFHSFGKYSLNPCVTKLHNRHSKEQLISRGDRAWMPRRDSLATQDEVRGSVTEHLEKEGADGPSKVFVKLIGYNGYTGPGNCTT